MKLLFLLIFCMNVIASSEEVFRFGDSRVIFTAIDGFTVNRSCESRSCEAYKKVREFKDKVVSKDLLTGGKNPAAVKCKELMKGMVIIGTDSMGHESSFCYFKDKSFVKN